MPKTFYFLDLKHVLLLQRKSFKFFSNSFCGFSGKEPACQSRRYKRCWFDPWVGKIPWRRPWQPTPVFLPRESMTEEPGGLQSMGSQSDMTTATQHAHARIYNKEVSTCFCVPQNCMATCYAKNKLVNTQLVLESWFCKN